MFNRKGLAGGGIFFIGLDGPAAKRQGGEARGDGVFGFCDQHLCLGFCRAGEKDILDGDKTLPEICEH